MPLVSNIHIYMYYWSVRVCNHAALIGIASFLQVKFSLFLNSIAAVCIKVYCKYTLRKLRRTLIQQCSGKSESYFTTIVTSLWSLYLTIISSLLNDDYCFMIITLLWSLLYYDLYFTMFIALLWSLLTMILTMIFTYYDHCLL